MLRLGEHVGSDELGMAMFVGHDHDLARAGDRVDRDGAEDVLLGQGHEEVARADDLVDADEAAAPLLCREAMGQRGHALRATAAGHLRDAELVAGGEDMEILRAVLRRRGDDDDLADARHLRRHDGHQERRRVGCRAPRHADADPVEREITLPQ